jgi:tetratricopeptide (TPR) repeat protein
MKRSILLLSFLAFNASVFACINEMKALISGKHEITHTAEAPVGRDFDDTIYYKGRLMELDSLWKAEKNIDHYSDYGVQLIYLGRYNEAKAVFHEIHKRQPGRYATAANIGTIYELLGQNDSALYWIKEAVRIDPTSHMNSEWIHVNILEAKVRGEAFVNAKFLIGTEFGNDIKPVTTLSEDELGKLKVALRYQLSERMSFIKSNDKIVGLLLFELGNMVALQDDVTTALRIYDKAVAYGFANNVLKKRYEHFLTLQKGLKNEYDSLKGRPWDKLKEQPATLVKSATTNNNSPYKTIMWISGTLFVLIAAVLLWRAKTAKP